MRGRSLGAAGLVMVLALATAPPATASLTIGQLTPGTATTSCAHDEADTFQASITSGTSYAVPATGTLTSWSHNARADTGQQLTMKVFRKMSDPAIYQVVGHDGPRPLVGGTVNTFPTSIAVKPGDLLGLDISSPVATACAFPATPGDTILALRFPPDGSAGVPGLQDGAAGAFDMSEDSVRLNISAVVQPSNSFTFGKARLNKKKGTATLNFTLPNPGDLTASGKGVNASSAGARNAKSVSAGPAQLLIKAKGKKRKKLNRKGKVKLKVVVSYTPTGGSASTQSVKVKLKKKH